jgi:hypothetical protein
MRRHIKTKILLFCAAVTGFLAAFSPAMAHHGTPAYKDTLVELKQATVTKFTWSNPHCLLYFDVKNDEGKIEHWVVETGPPAALQALGWTRNSIHPGDVSTIYLYPAKSGNPVGRLNHVVLPNGTDLQDSRLGGENRPQ